MDFQTPRPIVEALDLDDMALRGFMREKVRAGLDDGFLFGDGGSGFQRMNIAYVDFLSYDLYHVQVRGIMLN